MPKNLFWTLCEEFEEIDEIVTINLNYLYSFGESGFGKVFHKNK